MAQLTLSPAQIAALEADRLKLIVVPLEVQPDYVFHSVVSGSVKEMHRTIGENAYGQEQRVSVPIPHAIGDRIETPHGNMIVTGVTVKRVQDVTEGEAVAAGAGLYVLGHGFITESELRADAGYSNFLSPHMGFEAICCEIHGPDAWSNNVWCAFLTVEKEQNDD